VETLETRIASLEATALRIENLLAALLEQRAVQTHYSVADMARLTSKSEYQLRDHLKKGRILGEKRASGRGRSKEWMVSHDELCRYKAHGLLPLQ